MKPQLTESEARGLLKDLSWNDQSNSDNLIRILREKGYIKKSKLEEAREFVNNVDTDTDDKSVSAYERGVQDCAEYFEEAIKEIQESK